MLLLDLTLNTPAENLACDEALLRHCEAGYDQQILRLWEPRETFVVLGYSSRLCEDVKLPACRAAAIPIFRRCSGGGTVLQGPGCLNYSLLLRQKKHGPLSTISGTTTFVLERHRNVLQKLLNQPVRFEGHSDLVTGSRKFSGNAQRRRKDWILFHGSFLLSSDFSLMEKVLALPGRQPAYREQRSHMEFLINLPLASSALKRALAAAWKARDPLPGNALSPDSIASLVKETYSNVEWTKRC